MPLATALSTTSRQTKNGGTRRHRRFFYKARPQMRLVEFPLRAVSDLTWPVQRSADRMELLYCLRIKSIFHPTNESQYDSVWSNKALIYFETDTCANLMFVRFTDRNLRIATECATRTAWDVDPMIRRIDEQITIVHVQQRIV